MATECLFFHCFQVELEFRNVGFCGERKTGEPSETPSEQEREPTRNSTHIWRQLRDLNPGLKVGGERSHHCAIPDPLNHRGTRRVGRTPNDQFMLSLAKETKRNLTSPKLSKQTPLDTFRAVFTGHWKTSKSYLWIDFHGHK